MIKHVKNLRELLFDSREKRLFKASIWSRSVNPNILWAYRKPVRAVIGHKYDTFILDQGQVG